MGHRHQDFTIRPSQFPSSHCIFKLWLPPLPPIPSTGDANEFCVFIIHNRKTFSHLSIPQSGSTMSAFIKSHYNGTFKLCPKYPFSLAAIQSLFAGETINPKKYSFQHAQWVLLFTRTIFTINHFHFHPHSARLGPSMQSGLG